MKSVLFLFFAVSGGLVAAGLVYRALVLVTAALVRF